MELQAATHLPKHTKYTVMMTALGGKFVQITHREVTVVRKKPAKKQSCFTSSYHCFSCYDPLRYPETRHPLSTSP